jgi:hypothetical protein
MSVNWIAAVATLLAAFTIAANLGARVTGWGFVGYVLASAIWIATETAGVKPDASIVFMHSVLLLVNLFGAWRWLAVKKRHEEGRERAAEHSRRARVPTLFSAESLINSAVRGDSMKTRATVVDAMLRCDQKDLAYVVTTEGGVGGAGATLRAVPPEHLRFDEDDVKCDLTEAQWQSLPAIEDDRWPKTAPPAQG